MGCQCGLIGRKPGQQACGAESKFQSNIKEILKPLLPALKKVY
jgi:hypothetical protein